MIRASNGHAGSQSKHSGDVSSRDQLNREWSCLHGRMECPVIDYLLDNRKPPVALLFCINSITTCLSRECLRSMFNERVVRVRVGVDPVCVLTKFSFDASNCLICLNYINIPPQLQLCERADLLGHGKVSEDLLTTTADYHDTQIA
jgi:hypothetical protein